MLVFVCLFVFCLGLAWLRNKISLCQNVLVHVGTEIKNQLPRSFILTQKILVFELSNAMDSVGTEISHTVSAGFLASSLRFLFAFLSMLLSWAYVRPVS